MDREAMLARTKAFSLRILKLCESLPKSRTGHTIANQLIRSGTSVGANYRAAVRARSTAEFVAKLGIVEEEADESCFWLELVIETELVNPERVKSLLQEANEITAIIVVTKKSAKRNRKSKIVDRK